MNLLSTTVITRDWNWDYQGFASKGSIFEDDLYFILIYNGIYCEKGCESPWVHQYIDLWEL